MYRDFGAPRRTRSHLCSSGPSDQPADRANHSRTIFPSEIQQITGLSCTGVPCLRSHRSITQSISLLSPATLSLSSRRRRSLSRLISTFRPSPASAPPQKGFSPAVKKNPGGCHRFLRLIWPEKDRDRQLPPKLQVVDSRSSAINDRQDTTIRILDIRSTRIDHRLA